MRCSGSLASGHTTYSDMKYQDSYSNSKSKTDQYRKEKQVIISKGQTAACPFKILWRYMSRAKNSQGSEQFIYRLAYRNAGTTALINKNKTISYTPARETVVSRLRKVTGETNIGLHSLRAGVRCKTVRHAKLSASDTFA